jgi:hypothetical protein
MSVKRFSFMTDLPLRHDEYVLASDYAALEAKYKSAVEALRLCAGRIKGGYIDAVSYHRALDAAEASLSDHAASKGEE